MMKTKKLLVLGLLLAAVLIVPTSAKAQTIGELQALINALVQQLSYLTQYIELAQQWLQPCQQPDASYNFLTGATCPRSERPTITVKKPNGGETWQLNSGHSILWTPYDPYVTNTADHVSAYLEKLVNDKYVTVGQVLVSGQASIHWYGEIGRPGAGNWSLASPGSYYIRVVNNGTGAWDRSDRPFSLVPSNTIWADLKINGSDGPIVNPVGMAEYPISWTSNAQTCTLYNNTLWGTEHEDEGYITNLSSSGNLNVFLAPVPSGQSGEEYNFPLLSLSCKTSLVEGNGNDSVYTRVFSDSGRTAGSSVTGGSNMVRVISPNGGETINPSGLYNVTWTASSDIQDISISLYKDDMFYKQITTNLPPQTRSYPWIPSSTISSAESGSNFKIYILGRNNGRTTVIEDKSDTPFTISNSRLTPPTPPVQPSQPLQPTQPAQLVPTIVSSNPPNGAIDARSGSNGWDRVDLNMSFYSDINAWDFSVTSSNTSPISIDGSTVHDINSPRTIELSRSLLPGERIRITHGASNTSTCLGFLPGDVDQSGVLNSTDLLTMIDIINGVRQAPLYAADLDRNGQINATDHLTLVDLINTRNGASLPACPGGSQGQIDSSTQLASLLSRLQAALGALQLLGR